MKKLFVLALIAVVAGGISSCSKSSTGDTSLEKVMKEGKFVLGLDESFPPMGFRDPDTNEIVGYDIDLAKEVCKRLGVEFLAQPINWNAKEQELRTGKIDCIWNGFTITEERKKEILYSPPYLANAQVVIVNENSPVKTLADLAGKTVDTQKGSSSVDAIDAMPDFKASLKSVIELDNFLTAFMDLESGRADAVVADLVVGNYDINKTGKKFVKLEETLGTEQFGIGFRKNDKALEEKVWSILLEMESEGVIAEISKKWFNEDISVVGK
ncbi:MAG: amino acid ABC transporter substrate-binding protein [Spirochaetaceae bacterium]|jgi:polar amino acid transport system substrate-binding protein|nr:amino acid ABC transporter substrate-binding protein [Spirochaetaceae bacterium]